MGRLFLGRQQARVGMGRERVLGSVFSYRCFPFYSLRCTGVQNEIFNVLRSHKMNSLFLFDIFIFDYRSHNLQCQRVFQVNAPVNCVCLHPNQVNKKLELRLVHGPVVDFLLFGTVISVQTIHFLKNYTPEHWACKHKFYLILDICISVCKIHRGYYMVARRYEFYVLVARTISHSFAILTREILFLPWEHKFHIFEPTCNVLFIVWRLNIEQKQKTGIVMSLNDTTLTKVT